MPVWSVRGEDELAEVLAEAGCRCFGGLSLIRQTLRTDEDYILMLIQAIRCSDKCVWAMADVLVDVVVWLSRAGRRRSNEAVKSQRQGPPSPQLPLLAIDAAVTIRAPEKVEKSVIRPWTQRECYGKRSDRQIEL